MKNSLLALALALGMMPLAALAQDTTVQPAMTDQQRQDMHQTFERFAQQEMQLHQQMRSQILTSLTPVHLRIVGSTIGNLAIQQNPDMQAAARQIDRVLSPGERQRVIAAHEAFRSQSRQLHDQMRSEMQSMMPAGHPDMKPEGTRMQPPPQDAGTILLMALSPHPMLEMHGQMMEGMPHR
jgi:hypothetical protein